MSVKGTNYARRIRGLRPTEKLVLFVIADHVNHHTGLCTAGMATIAAEAGLKDRLTASRITGRLLKLE